LDFIEAHIWKLVKSYEENIQDMQPLVSPRALKALVLFPQACALDLTISLTSLQSTGPPPLFQEPLCDRSSRSLVLSSLPSLPSSETHRLNKGRKLLGRTKKMYEAMVKVTWKIVNFKSSIIRGKNGRLEPDRLIGMPSFSNP
jgi:hypothetical protein